MSAPRKEQSISGYINTITMAQMGLPCRGGGRRFGYLSLQEEAELLDSIRPIAEKGRILNAFTIKEQIEERLAKKVSKDYLYDLLHRHKWRKVMPRPQHLKADKEMQEEFKKNFRSWWQPPKKTSVWRIKDQ